MRDLGRWRLFTTNALDLSASGKLTCVSCRVSPKGVGGATWLKCLLWASKGNTLLKHFCTLVSSEGELTTEIRMMLLIASKAAALATLYLA